MCVDCEKKQSTVEGRVAELEAQVERLNAMANAAMDALESVKRNPMIATMLRNFGIEVEKL